MDAKFELNVNYIKQILFEEIKKINETIQQRKKIDEEINFFDKIIFDIKQKNYFKLFKNLPNYEKIIQNYSEVSQKRLPKLFFYLNYLKENNNSVDAYHMEKQKIAEEELNAIFSQIKKIKLSREESIQNFGTEDLYLLRKSYKDILFAFKNSKRINSEQYQILNQLFLEKGFSEKEIVVLNEKIRINNVYVSIRDKNIRLNSDEAYRIIDILNYGFEQITVPYVTGLNKNKLSNLMDSIKILLNNLDFEATNMILPKFEAENGFSDGYSVEEIEYISKKLMLEYQNYVYSSYKDITTLSNYQDKELREFIVDEYYKNLKIYKFIRHYLDVQMNKYNSYCKSLENQNLPDVRDIEYALRPNESGTFIEQDLKDVPKDLYSTIKDLLVGFKKDTLTENETKTLYEAFDDLQEIRKDQIRIIYKHISDNKYMIIGIFLKKTDNDLKNYNKMNDRQIKSSINYKDYEDELFELLENEKQYGGRVNS